MERVNQRFNELATLVEKLVDYSVNPAKVAMFFSMVQTMPVNIKLQFLQSMVKDRNGEQLYTYLLEQLEVRKEDVPVDVGDEIKVLVDLLSRVQITFN